MSFKNQALIDAALERLRALQNDVLQAEEQCEQAEAAFTLALASLRNAHNVLGFYRANVIAGEAELERLKPEGLCTLTACWDYPVPGGLGHCVTHAPAHAPCRRPEVEAALDWLQTHTSIDPTS